MGSSGATGATVSNWVTVSICGSEKLFIGASKSVGLISGVGDGAAIGSEKTGSVLVLFVMSSIAFCRSLSTV